MAERRHEEFMANMVSYDGGLEGVVSNCVHELHWVRSEENKVFSLDEVPETSLGILNE